ncbi:hypothetical protein N9B36_04245, partial [Akkermansiaceae bacterium]|nr:hypothetical protein [Akkermansiaceae bacterium]
TKLNFVPIDLSCLDPQKLRCFLTGTRFITVTTAPQKHPRQNQNCRLHSLLSVVNRSIFRAIPKF